MNNGVEATSNGYKFNRSKAQGRPSLGFQHNNRTAADGITSERHLSQGKKPVSSTIPNLRAAWHV
jgi:hypothetical protein